MRFKMPPVLACIVSIFLLAMVPLAQSASLKYGGSEPDGKKSRGEQALFSASRCQPKIVKSAVFEFTDRDTAPLMRQKNSS